MIRLAMLGEFPVILLELLCNNICKGSHRFSLEECEIVLCATCLRKRKSTRTLNKRHLVPSVRLEYSKQPYKKASPMLSNQRKTCTIIPPLHQVDISTSARTCRKDENAFLQTACILLSNGLSKCCPNIDITCPVGFVRSYQKTELLLPEFKNEYIRRDAGSGSQDRVSQHVEGCG